MSYVRFACFYLRFLTAPFSAATFALSLTTILLMSSVTLANTFSDEGLKCHVSLSAAWTQVDQAFGLSTLLLKDIKKQRISMGIVISNLQGSFESKDLQAQFQEFQKAKADFVKKKGGTFLGVAETLDGNNASGIYRIAVKYQLKEKKYKDSSYFRFVNNRLIHAKVLFPLGLLNEKEIENEVLKILGGLQCNSSK